MLVWCALPADDPEGCNTSVFFEKLAQGTTPHRHLIRPVDLLWGFTRPSQYTKARSAQEIDPFAEERNLSGHLSLQQNHRMVFDEPRGAPGHDE